MGEKHAVVFGSSAPVEGNADYEEAYNVGRLLGEMGFAVVNGGYLGVMEATARGAKKANARTIGITSKDLDYTEPNRWLDKVICSENIFERIRNYARLADAYIILKGSTGTLHEFMAIWDLMSLNQIKKAPIICLGSFWKDVVDKTAAVPKCESAGAEHSGIVRIAETAEELRELLKQVLQP